MNGTRKIINNHDIIFDKEDEEQKNLNEDTTEVSTHHFNKQIDSVFDNKDANSTKLLY